MTDESMRIYKALSNVTVGANFEEHAVGFRRALAALISSVEFTVNVPLDGGGLMMVPIKLIPHTDFDSQDRRCEYVTEIARAATYVV